MIARYLLPFLVTGSFVSAQDRADVHVHLHRPGRQTKEEFSESARKLVKTMDELGIGKAVILAPPKHDGMRRPVGSHRDFLDAVREHPGRLYFLGGGGDLNPMIQGTDPAKVTPEIRAEFERAAEEIVKAGGRGFGEMTALHLSMYDGHPFEEVSPDHPLFLLLADIAARHGVPIDLHMDAVLEDMDFPKHLKRIAQRNPGRLKANIPAFEKLLSHNPKARVVWQHASSDPVLGMTVELLRRLMRGHPNLFVAFRVPRSDWGVKSGPIKGNALLGTDGELRKDWLDLLAEFPDRFVIGSDLFASEENPTGGTYSLKDAWSVVDKLPSDLAKKVGGENAVRIYGLK